LKLCQLISYETPDDSGVRYHAAPMFFVRREIDCYIQIVYAEIMEIVLPIKQTGKSPLEPQPKPKVVEPEVRGSPLEDIPRIKLDITTQEIVEILRECRAGI